MRIGEVARMAGVSIHAVRFYERKGLLPPAQRGPGKYREFTDRTLERLKFIREAQALGFTLAEIRGLLNARTSATGCQALRARGEQKLRDVDAEIRRLETIKATLSDASQRLHRIRVQDRGLD